MESIILTDKSQESLQKLAEMLPEVDKEFLTETALTLTAVLYQKISEGSTIQVKLPGGKVEELRFKSRKSNKKKEKTTA